MFESVVFLQPEILWGTIFCFLPIGIFWFFRPKPTPIAWGAMRFLKKAHDSTKQRTRLREILTLTFQTLALASILGAAAFPIINVKKTENSTKSAEPEPVRAAKSVCLFIFDNSSSMLAPFDAKSAQKTGSVTRFEAVRNAGIARTHFWESRPETPEFIVVPTVGNETFSNMNNVQPENGASDWRKTLERVKNLPREKRGVCTEVVILSDLTDDSEVLSNFVSEIEKLTPHAKHYLISAFRTVPNLAISELEMLETPVLFGVESLVCVTISNDSEKNAQKQLVELTIPHRLDSVSGAESNVFWTQPLQKWVDVPAHGSAKITFSVKFPQTGSYTIEARLNPKPNSKIFKDSFFLDDSFDVQVSVQDSARFLIVEAWNPGFSNAQESGSFYIQAALNAICDGTYPPGNRGPNRGKLLQTDVRQDADLSQWDLTSYDAVFLCGIPLFTEQEVLKIKEYVQSGGGVWFFTGPQTTEHSFAAVQSILPAVVTGAERENPKDEEALTLVLTEQKHFITQIFRTHAPSGIETVPIYRWTPIQPESLNSENQTLLQFSNGKPFFRIRDFPNGGRVALSAVSADLSGSSFPLLPAFVPFVDRTLHFLTSARSVAPAAKNCPASESKALNVSQASQIASNSWTFQDASLCSESQSWNVQKSILAQILWLSAGVLLFLSVILQKKPEKTEGGIR